MSWYLHDLTASADSKAFHYARSDKQRVDFCEPCKALGNTQMWKANFFLQMLKSNFFLQNIEKQEAQKGPKQMKAEPETGFRGHLNSQANTFCTNTQYLKEKQFLKRKKGSALL